VACFFRGFNFDSRSPFDDHKHENAFFPPVVFTCRFLFAALLSLIVVPTLNAAPPGSTPPTYYYSAQSVGYNVAQTGPTPDIVAQAAVSYYNSQGGWQIKNLQACSVYAPLPGWASYLCYGDTCRSPGDCTFGNQVEVWAHCSPQRGAEWDGTEFYCPPTPECDGPAQ